LCFHFVSFSSAKRGGVYDVTVVRYWLSGKKLARLDLGGRTELLVHGLLGTEGAFGIDVFSFEDKIVNGPGHDGTERAQSRWWILGKRWNQFAVIQRHG